MTGQSMSKSICYRIMSFVRSASGLKNFRLFKGVDWIIYSEGGARQILIDDALKNIPSERCSDALFWTTVVKAVRPDMNFTVKCVGSKTTALEIDRKGGGAIGVAVAIDRDFDGMFTRSCKLNRGLRSWGYSWENCAFSDDAYRQWVRDTYSFDVNRAEGLIRDRIQDWRAFKRSACRLSSLDSSIMRVCGEGFFRRQAKGNDLFKSGSHRICIGAVRERSKVLRENYGTISGLYKHSSFKSWRYCYGKLIAVFARRLMRMDYQLSIQNEIADDLMIRSFGLWLEGRQGGRIFNYYQRQVSNCFRLH